MDTSKKHKKLTLKLQYLRAELEEIEDNQSRARWELNNAIFEVFAKLGKKIPTNGQQKDPPTEEEPQPTVDDKLDPEIKKLIRKIAIKTHPDKTASLEEQHRLYYESLYRDAMSAATSGDEGRIIEIALEVGINIDIDDERHIRPLEVLTENLEKKIEDIKKTTEIAWFSFSDKDDIRSNILIAILKNMSLDLERAIALDVVKWAKAGCPNGTAYTKISRPKPPHIWEKRKPGTRPERITR